VPSAKKKPAAKSAAKTRTKPNALLDALQAALEDGKAEDIARIDLRGKSSIADDMLIASGRSARQVAALADRVVETLAGRGQKRTPVEGLRAGDWVLIDAGDVIVHLFRPEIRARYNLEKMWGAAFDGSE
jgi:ribosome-associated protein